MKDTKKAFSSKSPQKNKLKKKVLGIYIYNVIYYNMGIIYGKKEYRSTYHV